MKQDVRKIPDGLERMVCAVEVSRITAERQVKVVADHVTIEQAVTVMVDKVGSFTIMCTPSDIESLAIGFIYSEGMIDGMDDVVAVSIKQQLPNVVGLRLEDPSRIAIKRN